MRFFFITAILVSLAAYFFLQPPSATWPDITKSEEVESVRETALPESRRPIRRKRVARPAVPPASAPVAVNKAPALASKPPDSRSARITQFVIEDGVAVVHGDMVVGQIAGAPATGKVLLPQIYPWKRNEIAVAIDPSLPRPERIQQALAMFEGTAVKFIPFTDQEDAIVFIPAVGHCKSYVGKVKGKQPIWIAPNCEADSVAHEILHALGFVHEQSRTDRDSYVEVLEENVKPEFRFNFEKLPDDFMSVTGLSDFDYSSIMMYPPTAFSKDGQPTIASKNPNFKVEPSKTLSQKDIDRINQEFGRK